MRYKKMIISLIIISLFLVSCTSQRNIIIDNPDHVTSQIVHCHAYSTATQTITNTSKYKIVVFENIMPCTNIGFDTENFTINLGGNYHITVDLYADKTGGAVTTLEAIILLNGVQINGTSSQRTVNVNNEVGYFAINADLDLVVNDSISIGLTATGDTGQLNDGGCILCDEGVTARLNMFKEK